MELKDSLIDYNRTNYLYKKDIERIIDDFIKENKNKRNLKKLI
ncbi:hypothetical protein ['Fragaria x ananassa' phyllody phytoplasma]|nr:hypothetical protein ['Fragaria x ananassa' phyllody phytoplasma]